MAFSIRMPDDLRLELRTVASRRGASEGSVVRQSLAWHLERELRELTDEDSPAIRDAAIRPGDGWRVTAPPAWPEGRYHGDDVFIGLDDHDVSLGLAERP